MSAAKPTPMDPERLAFIRLLLMLPSPEIPTASLNAEGGGDVFHLVDELLADRDFWEAEAALEKNCRIETFAALVAARAACLDLQERLAVAEALGAREAAEVELLRSEVVHLEGELRIRVAKLAASGAP